jgi:hypothetical protein
MPDFIVSCRNPFKRRNQESEFRFFRMNQPYLAKGGNQPSDSLHQLQKESRRLGSLPFARGGLGWGNHLTA